MEPLSITVGALSLAKICGEIGVQLGLFIKEAGNIGNIVASLQADVKVFETILQLLHDTVNNADVKQWLSTSGRIEPYWESLAVSLEDAKRTLEALNDTVIKINKPVSLWDTMRKQVRLKFAAEELNMYQQRILRFKDTVQIILNTTTIWHQVSDKTIPEQVVPRLDETQDMIRRLGLQFNQRMASLQPLIQSRATASPSEATEIPEKEEEFKTLRNLRDCLKGAATVMTSASTIVGRHAHDNSSIIYGSDFGDVFPSDPSESTLNWIRENAIQESDEGYVTNSEISHGNMPRKNAFPELPEERDYDEELELEVMQAYYEQGLQCSKENKLEEAVRCFQNCIDRREAEATPSTRLQNHTALVVDAMKELSIILVKLHKWNELQKLMKQKLYLQSRLPSPSEDVELADKLLLAQALCKCKDYKEALLYCRSAEVGYRNRGNDGVKDRIDALYSLGRIYRRTNCTKEAEGCNILIKRLKSSQEAAKAPPPPPTIPQLMRHPFGLPPPDGRPAKARDPSLVDSNNQKPVAFSEGKNASRRPSPVDSNNQKFTAISELKNPYNNQRFTIVPEWEFNINQNSSIAPEQESHSTKPSPVDSNDQKSTAGQKPEGNVGKKKSKGWMLGLGRYTGLEYSTENTIETSSGRDLESYKLKKKK